MSLLGAGEAPIRLEDNGEGGEEAKWRDATVGSEAGAELDAIGQAGGHDKEAKLLVSEAGGRIGAEGGSEGG